MIDVEPWQLRVGGFVVLLLVLIGVGIWVAIQAVILTVQNVGVLWNWFTWMITGLIVLAVFWYNWPIESTKSTILLLKETVEKD